MTFQRLENVRTIYVPDGVIDATDRSLREAGAEGVECFVLWTGRVGGDEFVVETAYTPAQTAHKLDDGLCVTVGGDELHKLNRWLFENKQLLGVQIHTHPTRAYHSRTDSTYPIVTQRGGVSIVVPHFCRDGLRGRGVVAYRLLDRGWRRVRPHAMSQLLQSSASATARDAE